MNRRQRIYDELRKKLSNPTLTKDEKINLIQAAGQEYNKEVDREYNSYVTKQVLGTALEIGSAAIPVGGAINVGARATAPLLKKAATSKPVRNVIGKTISSAAQKLERGIPMPEISKSITEQFGRKIPQDIVKSGIHGAIDGSVFGIGRGLLEDKNPLVTSIQDGVLGVGLGAGIGGAMSKLGQKVLGNKLGQYKGNVFDYTKDLKKEFSNDAKMYYRNYIQDRTLNKNGNVAFTGRGLQEMLTWNPNEARNFPTLIDDIKTAKQLPDAPNIKPNQKPNVSHYEVYQGNNGKHKLEVFNNNDKRYYFTKSDVFEEATPNNIRDRNKDINNSINDYFTKNNPAEWLNSQLSVGAESLLHNNSVKNPQASPVLHTLGNTALADNVPLPNLRINNSINNYFENSNPAEWLNSQIGVATETGLHKTPEMLNTTSSFIDSHLSTPIQYEHLSFDKSKDGPSGVYKIGISYNDEPNSQGKIFTPEEIGNMSTEEFTKNEASIFEQVKNGQIQPNKINYSKFTNPYSNNRIYTAEEFAEMSPDEITKNKEALNHQIGQIGLPTNQDLANSVQGGGVVYVEGYTKSDGTKVKGYYRSK